MGGRCLRKWRFSKRDTAFAGYTFLFRSFHFIFRKKWTAGGDASENGDFQRRKQRLQGTIFSGAFILYSEKMNSWGRCVGKWRFSKEETAFAGSNCFFRSFHFIFRKKWTAELENRLCLMIMMIAILAQGVEVCLTFTFWVQNPDVQCRSACSAFISCSSCL